MKFVTGDNLFQGRQVLEQLLNINFVGAVFSHVGLVSKYV